MLQQEKQSETHELQNRLDTNNTQIEKLKEIIKNLIKEKKDLMENKEQNKRNVNKHDQGTNTEALTHCPPPPPSETCSENIPEFSLPSEEDLTPHSLPGRLRRLQCHPIPIPSETSELEFLQKENFRLGETVKTMTEELRSIQETMHQKKTHVFDKEVQTDACDIMIALRCTQHELKEVEKELKATYQHIKVLEDRDSDETHLTEMNYLREQVKCLYKALRHQKFN